MKKHIIFALCLLIAGAFAYPSLTVAGTTVSTTKDYSSYSIAELEALIVKLQKQLEEMKKGSECFVSDRDLSLGDGDQDGLNGDIQRLQDFLREKGYFTVKKSTGYFGKITRASLINFQRDAGIPQSGEFDAGTRAKIQTLRCAKVVRVENKVKNKEVTATEEKKKETVKPQSVVNMITLSAAENALSWTASGYSKSGFKVVWSKNSGPTYPTRSGDKYIYLSDPNVNATTLYAFDGAGTYHARVCEYLGGTCGTYSNEVTISLQ